VNKRKVILIATVCFAVFVNNTYAQKLGYINRCNNALIEVLIEDVFSPPVASRIQAYANIAAYEVLTQKYATLKPMAGQLTQLTPIPKADKNINLSLAAEVSFIEVAKKMIYTEYMLTDFLEKEIVEIKLQLTDTSNINSSVEYGKKVAIDIIEWAKKDNYIHTRTLERYVQSEGLDKWRPTAPEYSNALEPYWSTMRSFVADSCSYVKAKPNIKYSELKKSQYYKNAIAVFNLSKKKDTMLNNIALYWYDNPNTSIAKGHVTYFVHKATPGGHWIKIASQIAIEKKLTEEKTTELLMLVSMSIYEGFLSCWAEKYKSNAVRPETYINKLIDAKWMPLIETPPFPEYTSGHSVISSAAATILTFLLPKPHSFSDSSQLYIGLSPRKFKTFTEAAQKASLSRFYGGIHYMPALTNGTIQGEQVANYILKRIKTRR
jgi:hypothetical protein